MKDISKIKNFHNFYRILFIGILLSIFIINNSFIQKNKRISEPNQIKIIKSNKKEFPFLRKLNFYDDSMKVCKRSSENLTKYFETGDTKYVNLYELSDEENPPDYILSLIDYLSKDGDSEENYNAYMKHHLSVIFFFVVALACIPGWIICWTFYCCNCYCCCQKPQYRKPFFIIVSIINGLIIITCILGISKINEIFIGLTNTECSILRFINEMLDGETKSTLPKWGGVDSIINIFENTIKEIDKMAKETTDETIKPKMEAYEDAKNDFKTSLINACTAINTEGTSGKYCYVHNDKKYILDLAKKFGKYENNEFSENSYAANWIKEAFFSDSLEKSYIALKGLIYSNVKTGMENAEEYIEDMKDGIEGVKDMVGEEILKYSEKIDNIGRLIFNLIFVILLLFSILLEILLIILFIFSSRKYVGSCGSGNLFAKISLHILWNIFVCIMIVIFLFGTFLSLIGSFGEDIFQVFSFIISKKNLQSDSPKVLEDGGPFLDVCMNGDGIITDLLGIESDLGKIDVLKTLTRKTDDILDKIISFLDIPNKDSVYEELISEITRKNQNKDFNFVGNEDTNIQEKINLKETILNLNTNLGTCEINERWSFSCNTEFSEFVKDDTCTLTDSEKNKCYDPSICYNNLNDGRYSTNCATTNELTDTIYKFFLAINYMDNIINANSIRKQANDIKNAYRKFLSDAKTALDGYTIKLKPVTAIYDNFVGNGSILEFINCAFLGKNFKVLLYYLDESVGKQFKNLGIIILATGIEMALSICFTIVLIIIFNATVQIREDALRNANRNQDQIVPAIQNNPINIQINKNNSGNGFVAK